MIGSMQLRKSCLICVGRTPFIACSDRHALIPFVVTLEMCLSIVSFASRVTPRTLTL
jgi:hypothetical protein